MEHESHSSSESSITSIATRIFGGLVALVLIGGVLYLVYEKSGLDPAANIANAYDNCKTTILSNLAGADKIQVVNTPANSKLVPDGDNYTMEMTLRVPDATGPRIVNYSCAVAKHGDLLKPLRDFFR